MVLLLHAMAMTDHVLFQCIPLNIRDLEDVVLHCGVFMAYIVQVGLFQDDGSG